MDHPFREEWTAEVNIYDGDRVISTHRGRTPRATRGAAIDDAAWRALTSLCYTHRHGIARTSFAHIPRRKPGTEKYTVAPTEWYMSTREMDETQGVVVDLSRAMEALQRENHTLWKRLCDTEDYIKRDQ